MSKSIDLKKVRNIGIMAHIDAGKTTTTERILFYTGVNYKIGEVHEGAATMDYMELEQERGITITSAATTCEWSGSMGDIETHRINLIDTPGHVDFTIEVERSLRVLDGAVAVFDAVNGVEPQSETVWRQANKFLVPRICFINKMDKTGADFAAAVESIRTRLQANAVPIQLMLGAEAELQGVIDLIERQAVVYEDDGLGAKFQYVDIPQEYLAATEEARSYLLEALCETDDDFMEQYLTDADALTPDDIRKVLRKAVLGRKIFPVLGGSAFKNKGVQPLLDAVLHYLPSPLDVPPVEGSKPDADEEGGVFREASEQEPFCALAFKIITDPFVGVLTFFRVYSGKIQSGATVYNATRQKKERLGRIVKMHADKREDVDFLGAGDIGAAVGLKETYTGDTLCEQNKQIVLESIHSPEPVIGVAIEPRTKADETKLSAALSKLLKEDPSLQVSTDKESGQTIISGMGELHLDIIKSRLEREFSVQTAIGKPQVAYRETVSARAEHETKYAKQTGGRGQFGHVSLRIEPLESGAGFEFVDDIKGGIIPREFIPAVQTGVQEALTSGVISGFPVIDVKVTLFFGSFHEVDSSEMAFKIAASICTRDVLRLASPVLLEPIMAVEVVCPDDFVSNIVGDLNKRRANIQGIEPKSGAQIVDAEVPLSEMFGYSTDLRSRSQGRATFTMEYKCYREVPQAVMERMFPR